MKVKLKSWDEVVELAKEHGDYDDSHGGSTAYYLCSWTVPWGEWVDARLEPNAIMLYVDDACPYYLKHYMIENE